MSVKESNSWQPKIIVFACNWCSYAAAGPAIFHGTAIIRIHNIKCSGQIDPLLLLQSFERGTDGIMVAGCSNMDCPYGSQFEYDRDKHRALSGYLQRNGIEEGRFQASWPPITGSFDAREVFAGFIQELKQLGPIVRPGDNGTNMSYEH